MREMKIVMGFKMSTPEPEAKKQRKQNKKEEQEEVEENDPIKKSARHEKRYEKGTLQLRCNGGNVFLTSRLCCWLQ